MSIITSHNEGKLQLFQAQVQNFQKYFDILQDRINTKDNPIHKRNLIDSAINQLSLILTNIHSNSIFKDAQARQNYPQLEQLQVNIITLDDQIESFHKNELDTLNANELYSITTSEEKIRHSLASIQKTILDITTPISSINNKIHPNYEKTMKHLKAGLERTGKVVKDIMIHHIERGNVNENRNLGLLFMLVNWLQSQDFHCRRIPEIFDVCIQDLKALQEQLCKQEDFLAKLGENPLKIPPDYVHLVEALKEIVRKTSPTISEATCQKIDEIIKKVLFPSPKNGNDKQEVKAKQEVEAKEKKSSSKSASTGKMENPQTNDSAEINILKRQVGQLHETLKFATPYLREICEFFLMLNNKKESLIYLNLIQKKIIVYLDTFGENNLLKCVARKKLNAEVDQLIFQKKLGQALEKALLLPEDEKQSAFLNLVYAYIEEGDLTNAEKMIGHLKNEELQETAMKALIEGKLNIVLEKIKNALKSTEDLKLQFSREDYKNQIDILIQHFSESFSKMIIAGFDTVRQQIQEHHE